MYIKLKRKNKHGETTLLFREEFLEASRIHSMFITYTEKYYSGVVNSFTRVFTFDDAETLLLSIIY